VAAPYVAMLRAVNLGAHNRVSMPALREVFVDLGASDVTTHAQSGNVVFTTDARDAATLRRDIEAAIARVLGLDLTVIVRSLRQLRAVVDRNPFPDERDGKRLHVVFLTETPDRNRVRAVDEMRASFEPDAFHVAGREVYLHTPQGYGRSKLSNAWFEARLGVAATSRNWNTVTALAAGSSPPSGPGVRRRSRR